MLRNLAAALLTHGRISTTTAKAKEVRGVVEPLICLSRKDDLHSRREAYRVLGDHKLVKRLFAEIGPLFKDMDKGGYTRVVSLALPRKGDSAPLSVIELLRGSHYDALKASGKDESKGSASDKAGESGKTLAKAKSPSAPRAVKDESRSSKVMDSRPKNTPRKMEG
jgi:large subunit ribosomal protein L17